MRKFIISLILISCVLAPAFCKSSELLINLDAAKEYQLFYTCALNKVRGKWAIGIFDTVNKTAYIAQGEKADVVKCCQYWLDILSTCEAEGSFQFSHEDSWKMYAAVTCVVLNENYILHNSTLTVNGDSSWTCKFIPLYLMDLNTYN